MDLESILINKKEAILKKWFFLIMKMYPEESSRHYLGKKDKFANPVGYIISEETKSIYQELLKDVDPNKLAVSSENILRIRAVQDFSPASAASFVFLLKNAIREELKDEIRESETCQQLLNFELKIDRLALLNFNLYMKCRDAVHEIRMKEAKFETDRLRALMRKADNIPSRSAHLDVAEIKKNE